MNEIFFLKIALITAFGTLFSTHAKKQAIDEIREIAKKEDISEINNKDNQDSGVVRELSLREDTQNKSNFANQPEESNLKTHTIENNMHNSADKKSILDPQGYNSKVYADEIHQKILQQETEKSLHSLIKQSPKNEKLIEIVKKKWRKNPEKALLEVKGIGAIYKKIQSKYEKEWRENGKVTDIKDIQYSKSVFEHSENIHSKKFKDDLDYIKGVNLLGKMLTENESARISFVSFPEKFLKIMGI